MVGGMKTILRPAHMSRCNIPAALQPVSSFCCCFWAAHSPHSPLSQLAKHFHCCCCCYCSCSHVLSDWQTTAWGTENMSFCRHCRFRRSTPFASLTMPTLWDSTHVKILRIFVDNCLVESLWDFRHFRPVLFRSCWRQHRPFFGQNFSPKVKA